MLIVVAAAILDDATHPTRILCAQRSAPADLAGKWEFPGGKVEPGEDPLAAVHREICEELGVEISLHAHYPHPSGSDWQISSGKTMRLWLATITDGKPHPLQDHYQLRWVDAAGLPDLDWLPGDRPIVSQLLADAVLAAPHQQTSPKQ
ncbi:MAG: (deoxy)nucleoside triphosphate pyrophosphohydrolase [Trueperella sp.]|nr:(deoxy)nucleoside triphosphate pyrophosphohydrolase [Trueperella sp.]